MNVNQAIDHISFDSFAKEDGKLFTQSTHPDAVRKGLEMLSLEEGQRVLEIGTGSGYSTALLATLVGSTGQVTSIDIDPKVTQRAITKLSAYPHVQCVNGNGWNGVKENAPYDRIIAWTSPDQVPTEWMEQLREGGLLVAPFPVRPLAKSIITVRLRKEHDTWLGETTSGEGYIPMTDEPVTEFFGPEIFADVKGESYWLSSMWLKEHDFLMAQKLESTEQVDSGIEITGEDLRGYLLATFPEGYTFGYHEKFGGLIGYTSPNGFALLNVRKSGKWMVSDEEHASVLLGWIQDWKQNGSVQWENLIPKVDQERNVTIEIKGK